MSWIAEYDTQGREFPTCVHVTKTTGTMTHGATYVPIEDGKAVRAENAKLRELTRHLFWWDSDSRYAKGCQECPTKTDCNGETCIFCIFWDVLRDRARELGIEVS